MKTVLICGVSGQDGAYLAHLLLGKGYRVVGTTRDPVSFDDSRLERLGVREKIELVPLRPDDSTQIRTAIGDLDPEEIYALWGQSSVGASFTDPGGTAVSIVGGTLNLLEALRSTGRRARLFHASSAECFGDLAGLPAVEQTPFRPVNPYGIAKAAAHLLVNQYRDRWGLFASNGLLFNHESPLRPERFVTRKITRAARRIADGSGERLTLGAVDIQRDWGWAPEFVDAMWRILQQDLPGDFILATGRSFPLSEFVAAAFEFFGLDWRDHVDVDTAGGRPGDPAWSGGDPSRAEAELGWRAEIVAPQVASLMAKNERRETVS